MKSLKKILLERGMLDPEKGLEFILKEFFKIFKDEGSINLNQRYSYVLVEYNFKEDISQKFNTFKNKISRQVHGAYSGETNLGPADLAVNFVDPFVGSIVFSKYHQKILLAVQPDHPKDMHTAVSIIRNAMK